MVEVQVFPEEVAVVRLQTLRSGLAGMAVHVYRAGPWLIDAGFAHARRQLLAWEGRRGARACVLTHHHEDHVGNAAVLRSQGLDVVAPSIVIDHLRLMEQRLPPYRRIIWGEARVGKVSPLSGSLSAGGWTLQPIHTPGHAPDHHVLYEPSRGLVFSADLYIAQRVPVARLEEDMATLIDSLRRVRELEPRVMYCAHRGRLTEPVKALDGKIAWIERVVDRARELRRQGEELAEITRRVLGRERLVRWVSGGELSKRNLIRVALRGDG